MLITGGLNIYHWCQAIAANCLIVSAGYKHQGCMSQPENEAAKVELVEGCVSSI